MPTHRITAPDGAVYNVTAPDGATDADVLAYVKSQHETAAPPPAAALSLGEIYPGVAGAEAVANMATGGISGVASGYAGLAQGGYNALARLVGAKPGMDAADRVKQVQTAGTYVPRTATGQALSGVVNAPGAILGRVSNAVGATVAKETGLPALGAQVNGSLQALPLLFGLRAKPTPISDAAAATRAKEYVANATSLGDLGNLPAAIQAKLKAVATDATALGNLDPRAIERQVLLGRHGLPATRGDLTRNLADITTEENLARSQAGQPLRDVRARQDLALNDLLDTQVNATGAPATLTRAKVGAVQTALRAKAQSAKGTYDATFEKARTVEPNAEVPAEPFFTLLDENPDIQHLGWLQTWKRKAKLDVPAEGPGAILDASGNPFRAGTEETTRKISVPELLDLRNTASEFAQKQDTNSVYAAKVLRAVDKSIDALPATSSAWNDAIAQFKAHRNEFQNQDLINRLTTNKGGQYGRTPKIAAEDTFDTVIGAPAAEVASVVKSLGPSTNEVALLRGAAVTKLKELANKSENTNETGQREFGRGANRTFTEWDRDGKIDALFEPKQAEQLRGIFNAVDAVRSKPSARISGSSTAANLVRALESFADTVGKVTNKIPLVGPTLSGLTSEAYRVGRNRMDVAAALKTPLDQAAASAARTTSVRRVLGSKALSALEKAAAVSTIKKDKN